MNLKNVGWYMRVGIYFIIRDTHIYMYSYYLLVYIYVSLLGAL